MPELVLALPPGQAVQHVTREQFIEAIGPGDEFARKYFVKHADEDQLWKTTYGVVFRECINGAISIKFVLGKNSYANIKLLHTFAAHRKCGVATALCNFALKIAHAHGFKYFRVSANPEAIGFYRKCGFKFWGKQRSGCLLSAFKIGGPRIEQGIYERDEVIDRWLTKGKRGSCVEIYDRPS